MDKKCEMCGAVLHGIAADNSKRKYCRSCAAAARKSKERAWLEQHPGYRAERREAAAGLRPRPCTLCGKPMEKRQRNYCRACAAELKDKSRTPQACAMCGKLIEKRQVKYCKACAELVQRKKMKRLAATERSSAGRIRAFPTGANGSTAEAERDVVGAVPYDESAVEAERSSAATRSESFRRRIRAFPTGAEDAGMLQRAKERLDKRLHLSGAEIDRLVPLYGPPYDSYGKLRAYVDSCGQLPPESCLRANYQNSVDQYAMQRDRVPAAERVRGSKWQEAEDCTSSKY